MNRWKAKRSITVWLGLFGLLLAVAGTAWSGVQLATFLRGAPNQWTINVTTFGWWLGLIGGILLSGTLLYRVISALTLYYQVDRNAVTVHWFGNTSTIPMHAITAVSSETTLKQAAPLWRRLTGFVTGNGRTTNDQPLTFFSTASMKDAVLLQTANTSYVISPIKRDEFISEVEGRRNLGIVQLQQEGMVASRRVAYDFWADRGVRQSVALAFMLNLVLWGLVAWRYPNLASDIAMRFDANGTTMGVVPRPQILLLPLLGLLAWLVNLAFGVAMYRLSRVGALLLQVGAIIAQLLLIVAVWGMIRGG